MRARGRKFGEKRDPKIARNSRISWENRDFPSPKLRFSLLKIRFSSTVQRLSDFQEIQENLLQRLSDFFNGFPLSSILSKYSYLEYFDFPLRAS
jgi:hypothetical protein